MVKRREIMVRNDDEIEYEELLSGEDFDEEEDENEQEEEEKEIDFVIRFLGMMAVAMMFGVIILDPQYLEEVGNFLLPITND